MAGLHAADYVIFFAFLGTSLAIGVYHALTGGRQRTTSEFIMADRQLAVVPTVVSMLMSFLSAITILGMTAEMYQYGVLMWPWQIVGIAVGLVFTERVVVPMVYRLKLTSINEYLELRFCSKSVRLFGSVLTILSAVLYMGVAMYAPSVALEVATGLSIYVTVPTMAVVCVVYTALGGMRAVIWTDVFQFVVLLGGMVTIVVKGTLAVGGLRKVFELAETGGRLEWIDLSVDPTVRHTLWGFLFGWPLLWINLYGFSQSSVQRYSATRSLKESRLTVLLNVPPMLLIVSCACLTGLVVYAYFASIGCDPLASGQVKIGNELLPYFVTKLFADSKGFAGLFLAMLYSGALSSVSSSLSASAANTWEDMLQPRIPHLTPGRAALLNRLVVVLYGLLAVACSAVIANIDGPVTQVGFKLVGSSASPLLGIFVLGGCFRKAEWKGALIGGVVGFATILWISMASFTVPRYPTLPPSSTTQCLVATNSSATANAIHSTSWLDELYSVSYLWYIAIGAGTTIAVGLTISYGLALLGHAPVDEVPRHLMVTAKGVFTWSMADRAQHPVTDDRQSDDTTDTTTNKNVPYTRKVICDVIVPSNEVTLVAEETRNGDVFNEAKSTDQESAL